MQFVVDLISFYHGNDYKHRLKTKSFTKYSVTNIYEILPIF